MFYEIEVRSHIRVSPKEFGEDTKGAIFNSLQKQFENYVSKELGFILGVTDVKNIGEGIIIPGDGAAYYDTTFKILTFKPEMQEILLGKVSEISDFGAFMNIGPIDGMIHISQTMDDYVSFSKSNVLTGKESKKSLKQGDICRARVVAISYKDINNLKISLTMRQHRLGTLGWIDEELNKEKDSKKKKVAKEKK